MEKEKLKIASIASNIQTELVNKLNTSNNFFTNDSAPRPSTSQPANRKTRSKVKSKQKTKQELPDIDSLLGTKGTILKMCFSLNHFVVAIITIQFGKTFR